ncbi:MAG: 16S rRNA (adenine(1518)-N(6)/adenine(1519)-N(6))-dimethyltransferase RsmA [Lachnospiraceae bacterium]|nr:16S rRNA (adenine(1518)-N(6)/adenine(1519)-N(6))-dimethyltransferase RsmA [Lachnospiraceae bacterium]
MRQGKGDSLKSETAKLLRKYEVVTRKRFGQNFLVDGNVLKAILDAADLSMDDFVLEIGPGLGIMTKFLSEQAGFVTTVEIDRDLIPILKETLLGLNNVEIINEDILKVDLSELCRAKSLDKMKIVANLPYYITTPIIMNILESKATVDTMTFMVQKEVGDRMAAVPGSKAYGSLSLSVQYRAEAIRVCTVPPSSFMPPPAVTSEVIQLRCFDKPKVTVKDEKLLFRIIKAAFGERRKTLINALGNSGIKGLSKDNALRMLERIGKSSFVRAEELSLTEFAALSDMAADMGDGDFE